MPSKELILAQPDIERILRFADFIGLQFLPVDLRTSDDPRPRKPEEFRSFPAGLGSGSILLFRPSWVFNAIRLIQVKAGIDAGTYRVHGSNMCPIYLYFSGELDVDGVHRLGDGEIGFKRDWLHAESHEMRPAPPDMDDVYKQLCKHLLSGIVVRGGVHRYHVCHEAAELTRREETKPPFDYIEWPPPDLHGKLAPKKRGKAG